jgi:hypothetical protein
MLELLKNSSTQNPISPEDIASKKTQGTPNLLKDQERAILTKETVNFFLMIILFLLVRATD